MDRCIERGESSIRKAIWIFTVLLIFEAAVRRWILPSANYALMVIRDPIVFWVVLQGLRYHLLKDILPKLMMILGLIAFITTMLFGHQNLIVALYGLRISLLYFPFIFICANVITRQQILLIGKFLIILLIPIVALTVVQFLSPQTAWVNRGVGIGGDVESAGFSGALGYYRPPGIFSFISGLTDYYGVTLGFLLYFWLDTNTSSQIKLNRKVLFFSFAAYILSIPVSISRTHFIQTVYTFAFSAFAVLKKPRVFRKMVVAVILTVLGLFTLYIHPDTTLYTEVFLTRFEGANESEDGVFNSILNRSFGWALRAISHNLPFWGYGDGHFSNVGMMLLKGGTGNYMGHIAEVADATEMEWGRILCESGIVLGSLIILTRWLMAFQLFREVKKSHESTGKDILAWTMSSFAIYAIVIVQLKVCYNLGFTALSAILAFGACRTKKNIKQIN